MLNVEQAYEETMKYRNNLIINGKRVAMENPDRLSMVELNALVQRVFKELNDIDMSLGYEYYDTGMKSKGEVSKERIQELFIDFIDWYEVIKTPSNRLFDYIKDNYSVEKYKKILCVGDGQCSHLGRKLADIGYNVVSVDPVARKEFSRKKDENKSGKLHIVQGEFYKTSIDMIDWADLIVGAKITECVEDLIGLKKESVFNISNNAEIYNMRFKGVSITSSKVLVEELMKCKEVTVKRMKGYTDELIFVSKQRQIDGPDR